MNKSIIYEAYINGYNNGIRFAYIPNKFDKDLLTIWAIGFNDAKNHVKKEYNQIIQLKESQQILLKQ